MLSAFSPVVCLAMVQVIHGPGLPSLVAGLVLLALTWLGWVAAGQFGRLPAAVRRRPQVALHLCFWLVVLPLLRFAPSAGAFAGATAAGVLSVLPFLLWRLGYLLKTAQRGRLGGTGFADHAFYLWAAWGGSETPFGKGWDLLSRCEAGDARALERSWRAGLHLVGLAVACRVALALLSALVFGERDGVLGALAPGGGALVPRLPELVERRDSMPLAVAWAGIYVELVRSVLRIAARGHAYVGVLRLLGFHAPRNTDRPLLAESVVEFWNRYYFYFKEMLAEFFFYPAFLRSGGPSWRRILVASFAAAGIGNAYYHLLQLDGPLLAGGVADAWSVLASRAFYCVLLGGSIAVSMLRERARRGSGVPSGGVAGRWLRRAAVWTWFAILHVFADVGAEPTLEERASFLLGLFGLRA